MREGANAELDLAEPDAFVDQAMSDMGAAISGLMVCLGDELGLYRAMVGAGPLSPEDLAQRTGTDTRYVGEWLNNQAAGGYVSYDPATTRYELPEAQAMALADEDSPNFLAGGFATIGSAWADWAKLTDAFRTGAGVGWHEHDDRLYRGMERFFRPRYRAHLAVDWIPALDGVEDKLHHGARVADVGCGHGASTILMAQAFPRVQLVGYDTHEPSIDVARKRAADAGVADRVRFEAVAAKDYPGSYDLITFFNCLHDMGDPVGAAAHARAALTNDGTVMLVEPFANDRLEDNLNPIGRVFYGLSTVISTASSKAQQAGLTLGAQAGEERLGAVFHDAGFTRFRRAAETPLSLVFEARP
jgi:SAM-dependent methyltransferase